MRANEHASPFITRTVYFVTDFLRSQRTSQRALRLRHISIFRRGCALMHIQAQKIARIC
jgi:hypothetical protein